MKRRSHSFLGVRFGRACGLDQTAQSDPVVSGVYLIELVSHTAQLVNTFSGINLNNIQEQAFEKSLTSVKVHQINSRHPCDKRQCASLS